jgi:hypothetical protein
MSNSRKRCSNEKILPLKRTKTNENITSQEEVIFQRECSEYQHNLQVKQLWLHIRECIQQFNEFYENQHQIEQELELNKEEFEQMGNTYQHHIDSLIAQLPVSLQYNDHLYM